MNDTLKLVENINKASVVEKKMGYKNAAVFGGFSAFVVNSLYKILNNGNISINSKKDDLKKIITSMNCYIESDYKVRAQLLKNGLLTLNKVFADEMIKNKSMLSQSNRTSPIKEKSLNKKSVITIEHIKSEDIKKNSSKKVLNKVNEDLPSELQFIKSVGPKRIKLLNKLGINCVEDLLYHFPRRYEDRSQLKKFYQLQHGETETIIGKVVGVQDIRPRKGLTITKVALHDGNMIGYAVWFNQPFLKKQMPQGTDVIITGKVDCKFGSTQISVNDFEILDQDDPIHSGRIVPIYPVTSGLQPRILRSIIKTAIDNYVQKQEEFLPQGILSKYKLLNLSQSLSKIHFPETFQDVEEAKKRLVFEELFLLQVGVILMKGLEANDKGIQHKKNGPLLKEFLKNLPFALTGAQLRVLNEIFNDMEDNKLMNRLVQGDVGSGKTVLAAVALVKTVENGYQGAMMAPTEILASQHYEGLKELLQPYGIKVALLTGSLNKNEKNEIVNDIKTGRIDIVVGTHAVIQDEIEFQKLGLAVTDEQHRFGVKQRAKLKEKGYNPDVLVMTATPIPRTLALTVYGDLDISVIDELPPGRQVIKTNWLVNKMKDRVYNFIRNEVKKGRQVYYVCPLVEESDKLDVSAAVDLAELLQTSIFPDLTIGLMHGRLKQDQKDIIMREFKNGNINILVATTVVEVGVNVPNATLMVIENADRFGLAQLHQLRGRVGRGSQQSYCILIANPNTEEGKARMNIMQSTSDGFVIAEEDLKLRGPGEFFGTRQSGLPDLKIADILKDVKTLQLAREEALKLIKQDPKLQKLENAKLKNKVIQKFKNTENYIGIS